MTIQIYPPNPEHYLTKSTSVGADLKGECPMWMGFLDRIMEEDDDVIEYLQIFCGYCLTGHVTEHVLAFLYGTGANGKSVFLNTLVGIWGDYALVAPAEMFMASHHDRHPTELAMLRGVRLVVAQEVSQGRRWNEQRIKAITGGDPITARYMNRDFFTYQPQFKLMIAGNYRPGLRNIDEAIRRRFHLVPFAVTIPEEERDTELPEKLKAEWPQILGWAIKGWDKWKESGLQVPKKVMTATQDYMDSCNAFHMWLEECCEKDPDGWESSGKLFQSWSVWAERAGEYVGTQRSLVDQIEKEGYEPRRAGGSRGWAGLRVIEQQYTYGGYSEYGLRL